MFCDYCRRLFTFTQPFLPYTPKSRPLKDLQGVDIVLRIASSVSPETTSAPRIEVYEDVKDIFTPQTRLVEDECGGDGLKNGETTLQVQSVRFVR
jgi:hypothetical protein